MMGQMSEGGTPLSFNYELGMSNDSIPEIVMPTVTQAQVDSITELNDSGNGPYYFAVAHAVDVNIKTAGRADSIDIGVIYRLKIRSDSARSLNFIFSNYHVPAGAKMFIYNPDTTVLKGAYSSNNNKVTGVLPTEPYHGDQLIIDYFEPYWPEFVGDVVLGKINHDVVGIGSAHEAGQGNSGPCHVDINCSEGDNWQKEKRAVCKIIINGNELCSGALLNNTSQNGDPLLLTAEHCFQSDNAYKNSVFIFNYENTSCKGGGSSSSQSIAGAEFLSKRRESDFTFMRLSKKPLSTYNAYYAGWSRNLSQPAGGVCIHHPAGDEKKISTYSSSLLNVGCLGSNYPQSNFYLVNSWLSTPNGHGVTEGGSSGSPLFSADRFVIGQLQGFCQGHNGNCDDPTNDYSNYGKLGISWNQGSSPDTRLSDWLDPIASQPMSLEGALTCAPSAVAALYLDHIIGGFNTNKEYSASNTITASNHITKGATVQYRAGTSIDLIMGFKADEGTSFTASIIEGAACVPTCNPISVVAETSLILENQDLSYYVYNATSYKVVVYNMNGQFVYSGNGAAVDGLTTVWDPTGSGSQYFSVTTTFLSNCEEISFTKKVLNASGKREELIDTSSIEIDVQADIESDIAPISDLNQPDSNYGKARISEIYTDKDDKVNPYDVDRVDVPIEPQLTRYSDRLTIYPNPASNIINIDLTKANITNASLSIVSYTGQLVHHLDHVTNSVTALNMQYLSNGAYIIIVTDGSNYYSTIINIHK